MAPFFPIAFLMNNTVKQSWLEALRSGHYKQGCARLHYDSQFCCLGVLVDLYLQEKGLEWGPGDEAAYGLSFCGEYAVLPHIVQEWAGLSDENPMVEGMPLAIHNDEGASFEEIATIIENNL